MPRGRPRKDAVKKEVEKGDTRKKLPPTNKVEGTINEKQDTPDTPKKRGRKQKNPNDMMKPEDVIDYIIRNYPKMKMDQIKDSVVRGLKNMNADTARLNALDEIKINGDTYYCDRNGDILNDDARLCGFIVDSVTSSDELIDEVDDVDEIDEIDELADNDTESKTVKTKDIANTQDGKKVNVIMFYADTDNRTYKQVISDIEKRSQKKIDLN